MTVTVLACIVSMIISILLVTSFLTGLFLAMIAVVTAYLREKK